jgi:hypothetical protein
MCRRAIGSFQAPGSLLGTATYRLQLADVTVGERIRCDPNPVCGVFSST